LWRKAETELGSAEEQPNRDKLFRTDENVNQGRELV